MIIATGYVLFVAIRFHEWGRNKRRKSMKQTIEDNSSESIIVVTDKDRLTIKQEFKGHLSPDINKYKVMILSKEEVRRLLPIANQWLRRES